MNFPNLDILKAEKKYVPLFHSILIEILWGGVFCEDIFIKAEGSETRKVLAWEKQRESRGSWGWVALAHREVREKEALGTGSGD